MENAVVEEKRDCVRAALCAEVRFSVMDSHEYEAIKTGGDVPHSRSLVHTIKRSVPGEEESQSVRGAFESNLVDFLIQIEDKLDRALKLLAKYEGSDEGLYVGRGLDIAGGGMKILCENAIEAGQLLDLSFRLFRYPVVSLKLFGKVMRVSPIQGDDQLRYEVAVEFLDLDDNDKEWIISYVFHVQREAIRSKKKG